MGTVTSSDLDNDRWATTAGVHDHLDLQAQGSDVDVEPWIRSATDTVQAWWKEATDGDIPDDLPATDNSDPNQLEDEHPLLVKATELLAASEAHESHAQNFATEGDSTPRNVFLEHRAEEKFDDWVTVNGYGETDLTESQGSDDPASGRSSSLIDL